MRTLSAPRSPPQLDTYRELVLMLEASGFTHIEGFDPRDLVPFSLGASRLLLVAAK